MLEAIVLAAGESRRMGELKPLLKIGEQTFLAKIATALHQAEIAQIHIVVGYRAEYIIKNAGVQAHFVENNDYRLGQFSSLQRGIKALAKNCSGVIVCLGDQPHIQASWIQKLAKKFAETSPDIVRVAFQNQSGHPLIYAQKLFAEILAMPPTATAKQLMAAHADNTVFVEIDSDGILYDADTPRDFEFIKKYF